jgi:hypothetical protein
VAEHTDRHLPPQKSAAVRRDEGGVRSEVSATRHIASEIVTMLGWVSGDHRSVRQPGNPSTTLVRSLRDRQWRSGSERALATVTAPDLGPGDNAHAGMGCLPGHRFQNICAVLSRVVCDARRMARQPEAALQKLAEAEEMIGVTYEGSFEAEVHRLRGELLHGAGARFARRFTSRRAKAQSSGSYAPP